MYSIFLHFAASLIDMCLCYAYFSKSYMIMGATTSLVTGFPLLTGAWLLYTKWTQKREVNLISIN